jgi:hypothetical protein
LRDRFKVGAVIEKETEDPLTHDSERGTNDNKIEFTHDERHGGSTWREIVAHHTAIEALRTQEHRRSISTCEDRLACVL